MTIAATVCATDVVTVSRLNSGIEAFSIVLPDTSEGNVMNATECGNMLQSGGPPRARN